MRKKSLNKSQKSIKLFTFLFLFLFVLFLTLTNISSAELEQIGISDFIKNKSKIPLVPISINVSVTPLTTTNYYEKYNDSLNYYGNSEAMIKAHSGSTIGYSHAVIKSHYVSIPYYTKKDSKPFEIVQYVGNDNVLYSIYHSPLNYVSYKDVIFNGTKIGSVRSKEGYVHYYVDTFSTYVITDDDPICINSGGDYYNFNLSLYHTFSEGYVGYGENSYDSTHRLRIDHKFCPSCSPWSDYLYLDRYYYYYYIPANDSAYKIYSYGDLLVFESGLHGYSGSLNDNKIRLYHLNSGDWLDSPPDDTLVYTSYVNQTNIDCGYSEGGGGGGNYSSLNDGMMGYWAFDSTISGFFPNSVSGGSGLTIGGSATLDSGKINGSMNTTGGTDYAIFPSDYRYGGDRTMCTWSKSDDGSGGYPILAQQWAGSFYWDYATADKIRWLTGAGQLDGNTDVQDGNWHFHCISTTTGNTSIYLDGYIDATTTTTLIAPNHASDGEIAGDGASASVNGLTDEFMFWNRSLNASEIYEVYSKSNAGQQYPFTDEEESGYLGYSLLQEMNEVSLGFNSHVTYLNASYFNGSYYDCFVDYQDPTNNNSLRIYSGYSSLNTEKFEVSLYSNCSIYMETYESNYTTQLTWGVLDSNYSNEVSTTFHLNITGYSGDPPNETAPFGCTFIDNCYYDTDIYLYDDAQLQFNDFYSNYDNVNMTWIDLNTNNTYFAYVTRNGDLVEHNTSSVLLILNPEDFPGEIIGDFAWWGTHDNISQFNMSISNSYGSIYQEFYYVEDNSSGVCEIDMSVSYTNYEFEYDESLTWIFYAHTPSLDHINLSVQYNGTFTNFSNHNGTHNQNFSDFHIELDSANHMTIYAYNTDLTLANLTFTFMNSTGCINVSSFSISVSELGGSTIGDLGTRIQQFSTLFPVIEDDTIRHVVAIVIILVFFVIAIIFIGIPLKFNKLSAWLIVLVTLISVFFMAVVGYGEWSWFVIPPVLIIIYFIVIKILGGSK